MMSKSQTQNPSKNVTIWWCLVVRELWKVVFNLRLARLYLLRQQVLLVEEENHRNRPQPSVQIASHEKPINEVYIQWQK